MCVCGHDLADEDGVVTGGNRLRDIAVEPGDCVIQNGRATALTAVGDALEFVVDLPGGEAAREDLTVVLLEDVDRESAGFEDAAVRVGAPFDADQHELRVEGDRAEGVDGQAARPPGGVQGGHDGDAGREMPHDASEFARIDHLASSAVVPYFILNREIPKEKIIIQASTARKVSFLLALLAQAISPGASRAQDSTAVEPPPERWDVSAELSFTDQTGNRTLRLLTGGLKFSHLEKSDFRLDGSVQSRYGKSEGEIVTRNHRASLAFDFRPESTWSPFLFTEAERDMFKRLELRLSGGAGAKYTFYRPESGSNEISLSAALLYSREDLSGADSIPDPPGRNLARFSVRFRADRELRPGISAHHLTSYQPIWHQMADYLLRSETGAKILLTERLALSVEYEINRTARPPEGVDPNDRLFKTGFIIDF